MSKKNVNRGAPPGKFLFTMRLIYNDYGFLEVGISKTKLSK
jgi:hypothetical protein